ELSKLEIIIFTVVLMILFVIVGFVIWGMRYHEQFLNNLHRLTVWVKTKLHRPLESEEIVDKARQAFIALDEIRNGKWHLPVVGALIYIVFDNLALFFLFYAAGHPVSILEVLSGYGLPLLMGKAAFILPGGLGIVETTMTAIFRGYGVPGSTAFAVVLVYRFLSFWFTAVMGYLLVFFLNHKTNNKPS
ncbi:MAG: flippase-like domain-containing protein, partial [Anaerolineaceae bacterium]|nr:flippase-like domain-containing protein [Anaerolineaceae bacterium]